MDNVPLSIKLQLENLPGELKELEELIIGTLSRGVEINLEKLLRIWRVTNPLQGVEQKVFWVEDGSASAGYQHMLKHAEEFKELGITAGQLAELAEAATTVGYPGGYQGGSKKRPGRPIFALSFYGTLLAVAISVGSNGFVVGMNRSSLDKFLKRTGIGRHELAELSIWPNVREPGIEATSASTDSVATGIAKTARDPKEGSRSHPA
ncbi:hypothetical protein FQN54_008402 [Arachnomyces sp. PD_36]|nr:hypothetical protein FQN54_008402 [Arachnomyces sp. PD_36]